MEARYMYKTAHFVGDGEHLKNPPEEKGWQMAYVDRRLNSCFVVYRKEIVEGKSGHAQRTTKAGG